MNDHGSIGLQRLMAEHADAIVATHADHGDCSALVEAAAVERVLRFLHADEVASFDTLIDLCAVDYLGEEPRFEVVYHLYSRARNARLRIKARVPESPCRIARCSHVWPAAAWMEREVWDLYGIRFDGHPDLRRLLLYEEFEGHPLRKDYPKERRQPLIGPQN